MSITRRHVIACAAVLPVLTQAALSASVCEPDVSVLAIAEWRDAFSRTDALTDAADDVIDAAAAVENAAALKALTTVPTTTAGLAAFCLFGKGLVDAWLSRDAMAVLGDYRPGFDMHADNPERRTAERLFVDTLAEAARRHLISPA